jgi:hypothetical protein
MRKGTNKYIRAIYLRKCYDFFLYLPPEDELPRDAWKQQFRIRGNRQKFAIVNVSLATSTLDATTMKVIIQTAYRAIVIKKQGAYTSCTLCLDPTGSNHLSEM